MPTTGPDPTKSIAGARQEHLSAEEEQNNSLGYLGDLVKDTAGTIHALTCAVPHRKTNEVRYLQEALDLTAEFQRRGSRRSSSHQMEINLVQRPLGQGME